MSPEEKELLKKCVELAEENNKMLQSMRRSMRFGRIMSFVYWSFIILSAVGAYYIVEPYLNQVMEVYGGAKSNIDSFNEAIGNFGR